MKKKFYKKWWFWLIVIVLIIGIGASKDKNGTDKNSNVTTKAKTKTEVKTDTTEKMETVDKNKTITETKKADTKVTYENFLSIQPGQSYADVVNILGEGKEETSSEVAGIKTIIYTWDGSRLASNMNVTIQNDVVIGKAQAGLKKANANMTLVKYNQITEGMTYDQVKEIIGEGEVTSLSSISGMDSVMYSYINKNGTNAIFTFSGDSLQVKSQFGLK